MRCIVTAGPTYEPVDRVRRLTNFSTGRLGSELAAFLTRKGHDVVLLMGEQATDTQAAEAKRIERFSTSADLRQRLRSIAESGSPIDAVYHAAAVGDFSVGTIWQRSASGELHPLSAGKLTTRDGTLLAELIPTPKIIQALRDWFPKSNLIGWKYEVDGSRGDAIAAGLRQIQESRTNGCVVNGPAYGEGFGMLRETGKLAAFADREALFHELAKEPN